MATYTVYVGVDSQNLGWNTPVTWYLGNNAGFTYNETSSQSQLYSTASTVTMGANEYPVSIKIESYNGHPAHIRNRYPASQQQVYNNTSGKYDTVYSPYSQSGTFYLAATDGSASIPFLSVDLPDTTFNYAGSIYYFDNQINTWNINGQSLTGKTLCILKTGGAAAGLELCNRAKVTITTQVIGGRVTVNDSIGGTITPNAPVYSAGATVTCSVSYQSGYKLTDIDMKPENLSIMLQWNSDLTQFTFTMPNPAIDILIEPEFSLHKIQWDQPTLQAEQHGTEIYVTKSGMATDSWGESLNIYLMIGDAIAAQFSGDTVVLTDDYFTPGEVVNLRLVAAGSSAASLGVSMNFTTVDDMGITNYYDGSGYQKSYIRRYNGTAWENVI